MNYIFDLDDTLIQSTYLNNDAYNYALEEFGYSRIKTGDRITREKLTFLPSAVLREVICEKQKYFTSEWLSYRTIITVNLLKTLLVMVKRIATCGRRQVKEELNLFYNITILKSCLIKLCMMIKASLMIQFRN